MDSADWESVKRKGATAVKRWIDRQLLGTSVTVVLIGTHTWERKYVNYEIQRSHENGKGMFGIYIQGMKDRLGKTSPKGRNPFESVQIEDGSFGFFTYKRTLADVYPTYDWNWDDGYNNMAGWIEEAARKAGR